MSSFDYDEITVVSAGRTISVTVAGVEGELNGDYWAQQKTGSRWGGNRRTSTSFGGIQATFSGATVTAKFGYSLSSDAMLTCESTIGDVNVQFRTPTPGWDWLLTIFTDFFNEETVHVNAWGRRSTTDLKNEVSDAICAALSEAVHEQRTAIWNAIWNQ